MKLCNKIVSASAAILATSGAFAGIAYDTISNAVSPQSFFQFTTPWQAEDTILDLSSGNTLDRVEVLTRLSLFGSPPTFSGFLTVGVFTSVPQGLITQPGMLLASQTIQHTWTQGVSEVISADVSGVTLASNSIWVGWMFANAAGVPLNPAQAIPFVSHSVNAPLVGATTTAFAGGLGPVGQWQVQLGWVGYRAVRVITVPAPGYVPAMVIGAVVCCGHRRVK